MEKEKSLERMRNLSREQTKSVTTLDLNSNELHLSKDKKQVNTASAKYLDTSKFQSHRLMS